MRRGLSFVLFLVACRGGVGVRREPLRAVEVTGVSALSGRTAWVYVESGGCYVAHGEDCEDGVCLPVHRGSCLEHTPGVRLWTALQVLAPNASGVARVAIDPAAANEHMRVVTETFAAERSWRPPSTYGFRIVRASACDGGTCPPRVRVWYHTRLRWTCAQGASVNASAARAGALAAERDDPSFTALERWFLTRPRSNHTIELTDDCRVVSGDPEGLALWRRVAAHLPEGCADACAAAASQL